MKKPLRLLSVFLQLLRIFFPGILFILLSWFLFTQTSQGKDLMITGLESGHNGFFLVTGLAFWVMVTWYTSRLIGYNNDKLFRISSHGVYHFPRFLGFSCFTVMVCGIAMTQEFEYAEYISIFILFVETLAYIGLHRLFEKIQNRLSGNILKQIRSTTWMLIMAMTIMISLNHSASLYLIMLPLAQTAFLFLVVTRRKNIQVEIKEATDDADLSAWRSKYHEKIRWLFTDQYGRVRDVDSNLMLRNESSTFLYFSLLSLLALAIFIYALFSIEMSRTLTAIPILLLSFGILLGAGNILSMLSIKLRINFHFLTISLIILAGFFRETHNVKLIQTERDLPLHSGRPSIRPYFNHWLKARSVGLGNGSRETFPVYLVLSDGGASRSAFWTAAVLSKLDSIHQGDLYKNLFCLSGSSGGSLGNMAFLGSKRQKESYPTSAVKRYLSNDFLSFALTHLMGPDFILPLVPDGWLPDRGTALEKSMQYPQGENQIGAFMRKGISTLNPTLDSSFSTPVVFINCTRMQDGAPAVISNLNLNEKVFGSRIDVLQQLAPGQDMSMASAVVLGARFPYFSPAGRIGNEYYVDAGYFDNSGAGVVHEMLLDLRAMIRDSMNVNPAHPYSRIRFHVIHITNDPVRENTMRKVHPLLNDLAAPISTITGSYARQTDINNLRLQRYLQEIQPGDTSYHQINLFKNGSDENYPMNWVISQKALGRMEERLKMIEF